MLRNMKTHILLKKVVRRVVGYPDRLVDAIQRLLKRYLARPAISFIGPFIVSPKPLCISARRDKPHILILRCKYYSKHSDQISTEELHLDNTLSASNLATFEVLTYDHDFLIPPLNDLQLIAKCRDIRPDAIVMSSWWLRPQHPSIESLKFIRERLGIPIASIWWDTCSDKFWKLLQPMAGPFDVPVIPGNPHM